ncbi:MAG: light-harvesting antenna LH1, beta subunit [Myxococcota bacterium]
MAKDSNSLTGISDEQAQEIMKFVMMGFIGFTLIAVVAHYLTWQWRPWIPNPDGSYPTGMIEAGQEALKAFFA